MCIPCKITGAKSGDEKVASSHRIKPDQTSEIENALADDAVGLVRQVAVVVLPEDFIL